MKLEKGKMITNSKGVSYYQLGKRYYRNTGFNRYSKTYFGGLDYEL